MIFIFISNYEFSKAQGSAKKPCLHNDDLHGAMVNDRGGPHEEPLLHFLTL